MFLDIHTATKILFSIIERKNSLENSYVSNEKVLNFFPTDAKKILIEFLHYPLKSLQQNH